MTDVPLFDLPTKPIDDGFDSFWQVYPRRIAKIAARKAWHRLNPSPILAARIVDAVIAQCSLPAWTKDSGAYIPHASTWINGARWDDELPPALRRVNGSTCNHDPRCATYAACIALTLGRK